jgi:hypothetical protein
MLRKTRRRRIRGKKVRGTKRVRGTRRVRIYYRGGNRRYNGEGGHWLSNIFGSTGSETNILSSTASNLSSAANNVASNLSSAANNAASNLSSAASNLSSAASTYINPKTSQTPPALTSEEKEKLPF